jgi:hypothetical protein
MEKFICTVPFIDRFQHKDQNGPIEIIGCLNMLSGTKQPVKDIMMAINGGVIPIHLGFQFRC